MERSLIAHAALAVVFGVTAAYAWRAPKGGPEEEGAIIVLGAAEELTQVWWQDKDAEVDVERRDGGVHVRVRKAGGNGARQGGAPADNVHAYPGSPAAKQLFDKLAPLRATRALGKVGEEQWAGMGLKEPEGTLRLRFGERERTLHVGAASFGTSNVYLRNEDGEVFLTAQSNLTPLRHGGNTLLDKSLVALPLESIERVVISTPGQAREVVQRFANERAKAFYADPAEPDAKLEELSRWLDRVLKLRAVEVVATEPTGAPALEVEIRAAHGKSAKLQLWPPADDRVAFARASHHARALSVSKSSVDAVLRDMDKALRDMGAADSAAPETPAQE